MNNLDEVYDALEDIASVSSRNLKLEKLGVHLKEVQWLEETIEYALNPFKHYKTSKVRMIELKEPEGVIIIQNPYEVFFFLDVLSKKKGASNDDKDHLSMLASMSTKSVAVVNKIIKKDLRCGVHRSTAKNFMPDLPIYKVMKAVSDRSFPGKEWEEFVELCGAYAGIVSAIKLDGYRVSYVTAQEDGTVEYLSTAGKPYHNFGVFDDEVMKLAWGIHNKHSIPFPMKFDGECVSKDGDFQTMQKHARRQSNIDPEIYRLILWEVVHPDIAYLERYQMLDSLHTTTGEIYDFLRLVDSTPEKVFRLKVFTDLYSCVQDVIDHAWRVISDGNEGLMLKTPYHEHEYKRSKHWFKLKALYLKGLGIEVDLPVIGFEYGREGTRLEKMLGAFICEYKGHRVNVSGKMSDKQRLAYVEDLPSFIEVHADSETNDGSLRLPIFQRHREDK